LCHLTDPNLQVKKERRNLWHISFEDQRGTTGKPLRDLGGRGWGGGVNGDRERGGGEGGGVGWG